MPRLTFFSAVIAFLLSGAAFAESIVIDMPPPPRRTGAGADGSMGGNTYIDYRTMSDEVDAGELALLRYARARYAPYYTSRPYGGYRSFYYHHVFTGYPYYAPWGPYYGWPFGYPFCDCGSRCLGFCGFYAFPSFVRVVD